ncbi:MULTISPECIES: acyl carrier protein [unclassified Amycolatopsis]|uniref:acyl carrier protein n=1 Tax=unclassified Amycolatopsis TaxID=2618356 RepID=UPI001FF32338|nr:MULTISPECIES: acyl carrier protein [unclassified Amycolatopsis]UOZ09700.1 acyl carrier protein [Amycolatopsis sp. WQ 127309]WSJ75998.1 acyl carrier protein [Amycolatopsis sp. NBC_01307]WSK80397.1 acyl carrier protein [Amycolatopsis sp. NBC_01286]
MTDAAAYADEIRKIVALALELPPDRLADSTPFDDIGLTSRQRIQLLARVEVRFGVSVDLDELDRLVDVRGVAEVISEAVEAQRATG